MARVYVFCEGERDRRFLRRLIREKKGVTTSEIELRKLDDLLRKERFEGVALIECGGYDRLLKQAARRSRDLANNPGVLPHAEIFVVGDSDEVSKSRFKGQLNDKIQKLKSSNPLLKVREEGNECVVLENLKEQGYAVRVFVLTVPDSLEKQLADSIRRLHYDEVKDSTDDEVVHFYCNLRYRCDEEKMLAEDVDVVGSLLESGWARKIVDLLG
jgi:hypothetical protein